jgi:MoaA/NifB/PqqE/SkfB family radical SAM enzyme
MSEHGRLVLDAQLIKDYNASRWLREPEYVCHASFSNMYFNVIGQASPCWLTFFEAPRYPENSIRDIWFGTFFEQMRETFRQNQLDHRCRVCERNINKKLFMNPLSRAYDNDYGLIEYPRTMEFELSNQCNLACQMCNGRLSSTIRRVRDNLPPHESPYDESFVEQLGEFLPHLKEARFNGGEPFLQKQCWSLWNKIADENPEIEITVATNGTVWSPKVEDILKRAKFRVNLSLDGFSKLTYESVRRNANFESVMQNVQRFGAYCHSHETKFSLMINPMRVNWQELTAMVEFCNENSYHLWFNTIYRPFHLAIWTLPSSEIREMIRSVSSYQFKKWPHSDAVVVESNLNKFDNLVKGQWTTWANEQSEREAEGTDEASLAKRRQAAPVEFEQKLRSAYFDDTTRELAFNKIHALEAKVANNIDRDNFYSILLQIPTDWVAHDLEHKSADQIAEELYYRAEYF